jgi:hypothetical protein
MGNDREAWTKFVEGRRNKYHARRTQVDGIWFDSIKESARYLELKLLEAAGQITELELQPVFPLHIVELWRTEPGQITTVGNFRADFQYRDCRTRALVIEDVKSDATKTEAYRLRKRIAEAIHGIEVREL